jgi:hypothetical protein
MVWFLNGQPFCYHLKTGQICAVFELLKLAYTIFNKTVIKRIFNIIKQRSWLVEDSIFGPVFKPFEN